MGLAITAYSQLTQPGHDAETMFVRRYGPFEARCLDVAPGTYAYSHEVPILRKSYSGYNIWRERLAAFAGYPMLQRVTRFSSSPVGSYSEGAWAATEGPFWELIDFSDAEGTLGTTVCKKLLVDFNTHVVKLPRLNDDFCVAYRALQHGLTFAADGGCVVFS